MPSAPILKHYPPVNTTFDPPQFSLDSTHHFQRFTNFSHITNNLFKWWKNFCTTQNGALKIKEECPAPQHQRKTFRLLTISIHLTFRWTIPLTCLSYLEGLINSCIVRRFLAGRCLSRAESKITVIMKYVQLSAPLRANCALQINQMSLGNYLVFINPFWSHNTFKSRDLILKTKILY